MSNLSTTQIALVDSIHLISQGSPDMPIANLQIIQGREPQLKASLIRAVTAAIADTLVKPESVLVILTEAPAEHWDIGGISAKELGR
jgi:4-oxalocrotonate tautomerase